MSLPTHVVEIIVSFCDDNTKAKCRILNKHFDSFVGDVTPQYIKNQNEYLKVVDMLNTNPNHALYNFRLSSKTYHVILADENNHDIYMYIVEKGYGGKTITRSYSKQHVVKNLKNLFKRDGIFRGTEHKAIDMFKEIFNNIYTMSLCCGNPIPSNYLVWKNSIKMQTKLNRCQT